MDDLEAFYRRNVRLVYAMALARDANPTHAEDLTQETFLRAWRHFGQLAAMDPPAQRAWLVRTLRHLVIDEWRREGKVPGARCSVPGEEGGSSWAERSAGSQPGTGHRAPGTFPSAEHSALRLDVARALSTLEALDREMVVLRYFLEMNSREIGEMLQMPEGTVRHRLLRARGQLAEHLAPWRPEGERA